MSRRVARPSSTSLGLLRWLPLPLLLPSTFTTFTTFRRRANGIHYLSRAKESEIKRETHRTQAAQVDE